MSKKNFYHVALIVGITAALAVAVTMKLSLFRAVPPVSPAPDSLLARATTPVDESKGGPKEGIKVHGHWTIDVRNPDGTLVTHREFENALMISGAKMLAMFLGRTAGSGLWWIVLNDSKVDDRTFESACGSSQTSRTCVITESQDTSGPPTWWGSFNRNLTVAVVTDPYPGFSSAAYANNNNTVTLSGWVFAKANGQIGDVETRVGTCVGSPCPPDVNTQVNIFTATKVSPPIGNTVPIVPGQIIQVTVTISFAATG